MQTYKCQDVTYNVEKDYYAVKTECGKRFNVFPKSEPAILNLTPGLEFTCELVQKGNFLNVVKGTFAVNMSTPKPQASAKPQAPAPAPVYQSPSDRDKMSKQEWADKDNMREQNIAKLNALTNLTALAVSGHVEEPLVDRLINILCLNAGIDRLK